MALCWQNVGIYRRSIHLQRGSVGRLRQCPKHKSKNILVFKYLSALDSSKSSPAFLFSLGLVLITDTFMSLQGFCELDSTLHSSSSCSASRVLTAVGTRELQLRRREMQSVCFLLPHRPTATCKSTSRTAPPTFIRNHTDFFPDTNNYLHV